MTKALQIFGVVWMAACAVLWLYIAFVMPTPDFGGSANWSAFRMLADSRFGLTMVPLLLAIPGVCLWRRGNSRLERAR